MFSVFLKLYFIRCIQFLTVSIYFYETFNQNDNFLQAPLFVLPQFMNLYVVD